MLLEFSCSNFKSIKEKVVFSMIAGSDDMFQSYLKDFGKYKILRSAIIYGANGSGKSNFLDAIAFMQNMVCTSINFQPGSGIFQSPHKLSPKNMPSDFNIQFVRNEIRYAYGFSVNQMEIQDEYLYYFPKGRQVKIFERDGININPGDRFKNAFSVSKEVLKENRLFLSCAANFSSAKEVEEAFLFFKSDLVIYDPKINNWMQYSVSLMQNDDKLKQIFVSILQALGTGIKDVKVKLEKMKISDLPADVPLPDELRKLFGDQEGDRVEAKVVYDQFEVDLMSEESDGVRKLFQLICPIIDILNKGKVLICDEFEASLHESIVFQIVRLFHYYQKDKFAQLIFSTHDSSLLSSNLFRRDQIWFTQLNEERATDLYSLAEIKNVRKSENLEKGYISGKYGAIPMLNSQFFHDFEEGNL